MNDMLRQLAEHLRTSASRKTGRYLLGITGPPGSGKSTLADQLSYPVVTMDGFHLPNAELDARGLRSRKGAPATFDADAFIALARRLRDPVQLKVPRYSRELHEPVADALTIPADNQIVIVEGNYLLLDQPPWDQVRGLLDEVWYLDVPLETCMERVRRRHIGGGLSAEGAAVKIETNDRPNAVLVESTRGRASMIVTLST